MIRRIVTLGLLAALSASGAQAATLKSIDRFTDPGFNAIYRDVKRAIRNTGDEPYYQCSRTGAWRIVSRRRGESNQATVKQIINRMGLVNVDDTAYADRVRNPRAQELALNLATVFGDHSYDDLTEESVGRQLESDLTRAFGIMRVRHGLEFYDGSHSYEDGTWSILSIVDTLKGEILVISIGSCGT